MGNAGMICPEVTGFGTVETLVFVVGVGQLIDAEVAVGLGLLLWLEVGVWFKQRELVEFALALRYEVGTEGGCKLLLHVETGKTGLALVSDSFVVTVEDTGVVMSAF